MTTSTPHFDQTLARITTHLRAVVAELRRLEQAGAGVRERDTRRELVARLQGDLAGLGQSALAPPHHQPQRPTIAATVPGGHDEHEARAVRRSIATANATLQTKKLEAYNARTRRPR